MTISRLGNRIRVAGGAAIGGDPRRQHQTALGTLPDGLPLIGGSGRPGLWFNFGHGASGWALSCGSARAVADLMACRPEIDMHGLDMARLG